MGKGRRYCLGSQQLPAVYSSDRGVRQGRLPLPGTRVAVILIRHQWKCHCSDVPTTHAAPLRKKGVKRISQIYRGAVSECRLVACTPPGWLYAMRCLRLSRSSIALFMRGIPLRAVRIIFEQPTIVQASPLRRSASRAPTTPDVTTSWH